jgi:hypothetical protein
VPWLIWKEWLKCSVPRPFEWQEAVLSLQDRSYPCK